MAPEQEVFQDRGLIEPPDKVRPVMEMVREEAYYAEPYRKRDTLRKVARIYGLTFKVFIERFNKTGSLDRACKQGRNRRRKDLRKKSGLYWRGHRDLKILYKKYVTEVPQEPIAVRHLKLVNGQFTVDTESESTADEYYTSLHSYLVDTGADLVFYYTVQDVSEYFGLSKATILDWIRRGIMRAVKDKQITGGNLWLIQGREILIVAFGAAIFDDIEDVKHVPQDMFKDIVGLDRKPSGQPLVCELITREVALEFLQTHGGDRGHDFTLDDIEEEIGLGSFLTHSDEGKEMIDHHSFMKWAKENFLIDDISDI